MNYIYKGKTSAGLIISGKIDALNRVEAIKRLRIERNVPIVLRLRPERKWEKLVSETSNTFYRYIKKREFLTVGLKGKVRQEDLEWIARQVGDVLELQTSELRGTRSSRSEWSADDPPYDQSSEDQEQLYGEQSRKRNAPPPLKDTLRGIIPDSVQTWLFRRKKVPTKEIIQFTNQLSTLLQSGVPIVRALETIRQYTKNKKMSAVIQAIEDEVTNGAQFSEGLSKHPEIFPEFYVSMVLIGENSGQITKSLLDILPYLHMKNRLNSELKKTAVYPTMVFFVLLLFMIAGKFMLVPKFQEIYQGMNLSLPLFTKLIFGIFNHIAPIIAGTAVTLLVIGGLLRSNQRWVVLARKIKDTTVFLIPIVRNLVMQISMYQLTLVISTMVKSGIRIIDALQLAERNAINTLIKSDLKQVREQVERGGALSEAFEDKKFISPLVKSAIGTGEQSGKLVHSLDSVSQYFDQELRATIKQMMEVMQPFSILIVAMILVPILLGLLLPMLELYSGNFLDE